jgi:transposase
VSRRTFYNWKVRFEAGGYAALEEMGSHAPKRPQRTAAATAAQVVAMRREHAAWGKRRIADELAKANNRQPLVTPNTVRRILQDAGLWLDPDGAPEAGVKKGGGKIQGSGHALRRSRDKR